MGGQRVAGAMAAVVAPALLEAVARPEEGLSRVPARDALRGIVFVPRGGMPWGCCRGRRSAARARRAGGGCGTGGGRAGPPAPGAARTARPGGRAGLVSRLPRAPRPSGHEGAGRSGPDPTDRGRAGTERHGCTEHRSTGAPEHAARRDANGREPPRRQGARPIPDAVPGMRSGQRGRPRERPEKRPAPSGDIACRDALPGEGRGLRPPTTPPGVPRSFDRPPDPTPRRRGIRRARARPTGRRARRRPGSRPVPPSRHPPPDPRADSHMASSSPATAIVRTNKARRIRQKTGGAA